MDLRHRGETGCAPGTGGESTVQASREGRSFIFARVAVLNDREAPSSREPRGGAVLEEIPEGEELEVVPPRPNADLQASILALYDEYRPRLFRYLRSLKLDRDQAEEVIQETFMRLTTQLLRKRDIDNTQGWVVRVAHNLAVDLLKKTARETVAESESNFAFNNRSDPSSSPEDAYLEKEQVRLMEGAFAALNPQQRRSFQMRVQGLRYKDIGQALKISEQRAALVVKQAAMRLAAICG